MSNKPITLIDKDRPQATWILVVHVLAVAFSIVALFTLTLQPQWVMPPALFTKLPSNWTPSVTMVSVSLLGVAALVIAPWWPAVGMFVFISLAYTFPRTGYQFNFFLHWHILEFVSFLTALGYSIWLSKKGRRPVWLGHPHFLLQSSLMIWIVISTAVAAARGNYNPAVNHNPILMFNAFVMFILAAEFLSTPRNLKLLAITLAITLCLRGLLAPQWVKGNGDLGVLLSMSIPLTIAGVISFGSSLWRILFTLLTFLQCMLLYRTTNRGGAVAIITAFLFVWLLRYRKLKRLLLILPILLLLVSMPTGSAYWQKFTDIWQNGYWKKTVDSRIDLWEGGWKMALDYPIYGVGMGNFENRVGKYTTSGKDDSPHNNIVGALAETGFVGALLYLAFFISAIYLAAVSGIRSTDPRLRKFTIFLAASLVAYFIAGMFMTRHTLTLAYLLAGGALAVSTSCTAAPSSKNQASP